MNRALLAIATALVILCGLAGAAPAAGLTVCNGTHFTVGFALGYVGTGGLESVGPFESGPGQCTDVLPAVAKGPFYMYGEVPTGALSWTGHGDGSSQAFCVPDNPGVAMHIADHVKNGRLTCPDHAVYEFVLVPDQPDGKPKFTFSEDNADRP